MSLTFATWLPGNGAQPEFPPFSQRRMAGSGLFGGTDTSTNFFHFPITTPVIFQDRRLRLAKAFVLYKMMFCTVENVQLWSGSQRIAVFNVPQEPGLVRDHPLIDRNGFIAAKTAFDMAPAFDGPKEFPQGLSITVKVRFDSQLSVQLFGGTQLMPRNEGKIEFFSAGADWVG